MKNDCIIVVFVEGDTEKELFDAVLKHYRDSSTERLPPTRVINLKGIGRFEKKVASKVKYEILDKFNPENVTVFCTYDTDVFELAKKPPTNWKIVKAKLHEIGVSSFYEIKAVRTVEDWFLIDLNGILDFLKLKKSPNLKGKTGLEIMKVLFKKGNKIYQKGSYSHKFIPFLDLQLIIEKVGGSFKDLEKVLGFKRR